MNGVTASEMMAGIACSSIRYGHSSAVPALTCTQLLTDIILTILTVYKKLG